MKRQYLVKMLNLLLSTLMLFTLVNPNIVFAEEETPTEEPAWVEQTWEEPVWEEPQWEEPVWEEEQWVEESEPVYEEPVEQIEVVEEEIPQPEENNEEIQPQEEIVEELPNEPEVVSKEEQLPEVEEPELITTETQIEINPFWLEQFTEEEILEAYPFAPVEEIAPNSDPLVLAIKALPTYTKEEDVIDHLLNAAESLQESTSFKYTVKLNISDDIGTLMSSLFQKVRNEWDEYYEHQYVVVSYNASYYDNFPSTQTITLNYGFTFALTAKHEEELNHVMVNVCDNLNLWEKSDFEKIKGIYDYMTSTIKYDDEGYEAGKNKKLSDMSEELRLTWTAYKALIKDTAVCQGYALLFYRFMKLLGIESHYAYGYASDQGAQNGAHAWNIVKLDGNFYCVDATWDAGEEYYSFFLRGTDHFANHTFDEEFANKYTISKTDYIYEEKPVQDIPVESITMTPSYDSIHLHPAQTLLMKCTITPENATVQRITYESSNPSIATVDRNGLVTPVSPGFVSIYATTENGKTAVSYLRVVEETFVLAEGLTLTPATLYVPIGKTGKFSLKFNPDDASEPNVLMETENESIATIESGLVVTGHKLGSTKIRFKTIDTSEMEIEGNVVVYKPIEKLFFEKDKETMYVGGSKVLDSYFSPADAEIITLTYKSSNPSVATVDRNGKVIAKKAGTTTISITNELGLTATCKVTVLQLATSVKLNKTSAIIVAGKSETLTATISPNNVSDKKLTWTSSNKNIATVDSSGKVTAKKNGTTTITVKTSNGKTATCKVTVGIPKVTAVVAYNSAKGADLRWKPINGVNQYRIYRKRTDPKTKEVTEGAIATVNASTLSMESGNFKWIDTFVKDKYGNGGWIYYIKAVIGKEEGPQSNKLNFYRLSTPSITKIVDNGNGNVRITWTKIDRTESQKFEIQYSTDKKNWEKIPQIDNNNTTSLYLSGLKKGVKYHFRMRCQKTNGTFGTTWSEYSKWNSITPK